MAFGTEEHSRAQIPFLTCQQHDDCQSSLLHVYSVSQTSLLQWFSCFCRECYWVSIFLYQRHISGKLVLWFCAKVLERLHAVALWFHWRFFQRWCWPQTCCCISGYEGGGETKWIIWACFEFSPACFRCCRCCNSEKNMETLKEVSVKSFFFKYRGMVIVQKFFVSIRSDWDKCSFNTGSSLLYHTAMWCNLLLTQYATVQLHSQMHISYNIHNSVVIQMQFVGGNKKTCCNTSNNYSSEKCHTSNNQLTKKTCSIFFILTEKVLKLYRI